MLIDVLGANIAVIVNVVDVVDVVDVVVVAVVDIDVRRSAKPRRHREARFNLSKFVFGALKNKLNEIKSGSGKYF